MARDRWAGRMDKEAPEVILRRGAAYQAEAILTMRRVLEREEILRPLNEKERGLLSQFPNGFPANEPGLVYQPLPIEFG